MYLLHLYVESDRVGFFTRWPGNAGYAAAALEPRRLSEVTNSPQLPPAQLVSARVACFPRGHQARRLPFARWVVLLCQLCTI